PEIPDRRCRPARQPSRERHEDGNTRGGTEEILHRQAKHLHEIAQNRFTRIRLPVRIRREAHRSVERQRRWHVRKFLRIERQPALKNLEPKDDNKSEQVKKKQRDEISFPTHLRFGVAPCEPVEEPFQRAKPSRQPHPLSCKDLRHVAAEQRSAKNKQTHEQRYLNPIALIHVDTVS